MKEIVIIIIINIQESGRPDPTKTFINNMIIRAGDPSNPQCNQKLHPKSIGLEESIKNADSEIHFILIYSCYT